jgi:hypothetical protein
MITWQIGQVKEDITRNMDIETRGSIYRRTGKSGGALVEAQWLMIIITPFKFPDLYTEHFISYFVTSEGCS